MTAIASRSARAIVALEAIDRLASVDMSPQQVNMSPQQVVEEISRRIVGVISADTFLFGATDPDTGLCLGPGLAFNFDDDVYRPFVEHELLVPDYNKFEDLSADSPVGDLRLATGGKLSRSPRYRALHAIADFEDELRATFSAGGRPWGHLQLNRHTGDKPFTDGDRAFLRTASPLVGVALRRAHLSAQPRPDPTRGPGVVVLDEEGNIISATAEAEHWFGEVAEGYHQDDLTHVGMPRAMLEMCLSALALSDAPSRRCRLRTPRGVWLVAHASPLVGSDQRVLVIEPAKASEIAPIVVDAHGLTRREVEISRLVARGLRTDEIASTLLLSSHTVRDHLKAVFEKVGVSSRGQLTSKLFAEHYQASVDDAIYTSTDHL